MTVEFIDAPRAHFQQPRWRKRTLIALLVFTSFCLSFYICWMPSPPERRLTGRWTATVPHEVSRPDHHVLMQLEQNGDWTTSWRIDDTSWQVGGAGHWSYDGEALKLRFADEEGRSLADALRGEDKLERLMILELTSDRLVTRAAHGSQYELTWTRTTEESPRTRNTGTGNPQD